MSVEEETPEFDGQDLRVLAALTEYLRARDSGRPLGKAEFLAAHPEIAPELESFLANEYLLKGMSDELGSELVASAPSERALAHQPPGRAFGEYEILEEIARGGMGVVYRARQTTLDREVALKLILSGHLAAAGDIEQFLREARAAARLDHPNIVPIYDVGEFEGRHFYSMKLLRGGDLAGAVSRYATDPPAAARLMEKVARAVHHAHERGIFHRDLKPGNILLDENGEPHVADFGLAKQLDERTTLTSSGLIFGTLVYAPPEQMAGQGGQAAPASDVYSLGAILYKLLSGRPPFQGGSPTETLKQILNDAPAPLSRSGPRIAADLETICLQCLEKDPCGRYPSALELAEDLRRYLAGEPIRARPPGFLKRGWKWARRRPAAAGLAATVLLAVLALAVLGPRYLRSVATSRTLERERDIEAETRKQEQGRQEYAARIRVAYEAWNQGSCDAAREFLDELIPKAGEEDHRGFEWYYLWRLAHGDRFTRRGLLQGVAESTVAFSPDGETLAVAGNGLHVHLLDAATGTTRARTERTLDWILAFSPDGKRLAVGGGLSGDLALLETGKAAVAWITSSGTRGLSAVEYSPNGSLVATASLDGSLTLREAASGKVLRTWAAHSEHGRYGVLAFSPRGEVLASGGVDRAGGVDPPGHSVKLWEVESGRELHTLRCEGPVARSALRFSADGELVAAACADADSTVRLWQTATGKEKEVFRGHLGESHEPSLAFSPDGRWLATSVSDEAVRIWELAARRERVLTLPAQLTARLVFSPDGKILATAIATVRTWSPAEDLDPGGVLLWNAETGTEYRHLKGHRARIVDVAFSPGGGALATASLDATVKVWDLAAPPEPAVLSGHPAGVDVFAFPDGARLLVSADLMFNVRLSRLAEVLGGVEIEEVESFQIPDVTSTICGALSADGRWMAVAHKDGPINVWRCTWSDAGMVKEREETLRGPMSVTRHAMFSPGGDLLVAAGSKKQARVWALASMPPGERWQESSTFELPVADVSHMAISPDRRLLALVEERQGDVWLWDLERRVKVGVLQGHTMWTDALAFSPDSRLLATGSLDWRIKLWRITREAPAADRGPGDGAVGAEELKTLEGHNNAVACVVLSPCGKRMASVGDDRLVKIWDPSTGETLAVLSTPGGNTYTLSFSPDGRFLVAGSQTARGSGEATIWRAATEAEVQARRTLESSWQP